MADILPVRWAKKKKRTQIRSVLRGYRNLQNNDQLGKIRDTNEELAHTLLIPGNKLRSSILFGAATPTADLVLRQYMMRRMAGVKLNKKMLEAIGDPRKKIVYPLPSAWKNILRKNALPVAGFRSSVYWYFFVLYVFATGFVKIAQVFFENCRGLFATKKNKHPYAYFTGLTAVNLPQVRTDKNSLDVFSWYLQTPARDANVSLLCHDIKNVSKQNIGDTPVENGTARFFSLGSFGKLVHFLSWSLTAAFASVIQLVSGKWWYAFMFPEAVTAAMVRCQDKEQIANDFLFHNSEWLYRPLWTYEAVKKGARVILYFYSTNIETFPSAGTSTKQMYSWDIINWPTYFVWDEYQADFIQTQTGDRSGIIITGPIWFNDSSTELVNVPRKSIAVFDITPLRTSRYAILGLAIEYFVTETSVPFLKDIYELAQGTGYRVIVKQKRKMGPYVHKSYQAFIRKLANDANVIFADPGLAATHLIEECDIVISMPFTSTALIGREAGKISVYYDPRGIIQKNDPGAHGIPIMSGQEELKEWFRNLPVSDRAF